MNISFINYPEKINRPVVKVKPISIKLGESVGFFAETGQIDLGKYKSLISVVEHAENYLNHGHRVLFDLSRTKDIGFEAIAFLLGNIEYFHRIYGKNKLNGTYSNSPLVNKKLGDSGFFDLLKINREFDFEKSEDDFINIKFKMSSHVVAETIGPLRKSVIDNDISLPKIHENQIFRALSEAMLNVHHHAYDVAAYKFGKLKSVKGLWWLGGQFNKANDSLRFVMYDVGLGIPQTMPINYRNYLEKEKVKFEQNDADLIHAAAQKGKTSTKKKHRGRGLPDMHKIVSQHRGELQIISRYGNYYFAGDQVASKLMLPSACRGTLVAWSIYAGDIKLPGVGND